MTSPRRAARRARKAIDHAGNGEKPAVLRDEPEKVAGQHIEAGALAEGLDRLALLGARQDRAAHEAAQIGAVGQHRAQLAKIVGHLIQRLALVGEIEQRRSVSIGEPGNACTLGCHFTETLDVPAIGRSAATW